MKNYDRKIFILDDNLEILEMITSFLKENGFINIKTASSKKEALELFDTNSYDFAILDIMLPDGTGFEVLKKIRQYSNIPVLFLSAISDIENQYKGFEMGADDYITKPFQMKDLLLRVISILNRAYPSEKTSVNLIGSTIDFYKAVVIKDNVEYQLTAKEYNILEVLYDNKNKIITIDTLLNKVWGIENIGYENSLMAHIRKIRQKIEINPSNPVNLITIKGLGYKLKVENNEHN